MKKLGHGFFYLIRLLRCLSVIDILLYKGCAMFSFYDFNSLSLPPSLSLSCNGFSQEFSIVNFS
jgi:hypothetical protein